MAIKYKVYQDNRESNPNRGSWYARVAYEGTVGINELAESIEEKCTVHKADVVAVIVALIGEMTRALQNSQRVKLENFGTFKMGLCSVPAPTRQKFTAANIKSIHVLFQPATRRTNGSVTTRAFITGARVKEWSNYDKPAEQAGSKSNTTGGGSGTGGGNAGTGGGTTGGSDSGGSSTGGSSSDDSNLSI